MAYCALEPFAMSYTLPDKSDTSITKEEWESRLEEFKIKRSDMNRLVMNYLVTGTSFIISALFQAYAVE